MSATVDYQVRDREQPRKVVDAAVRSLAQQLMDAIAAEQPKRTGQLAGGWRMEHGRAPATYLLVNAVRYARYVEFGTVHMAAQPVVGCNMARYRARWAK